LLEGTSSERVSAHKTDSPSLFHVLVSEFGTGCSFTTTLKTNKHDYI
jgi:hypothetical protein